MPGCAYNILLVDDHGIVREGVRGILERTSDFKVVGEAETGIEAVNVCRKVHPDMVLMDIGLPGMSGIEATTELLRHCPGTKVVILSMFDDDQSVMAAIRSGARGFILKKASSADLVDALRAVARGGSYLSSQVSDHLLTRIKRGDVELDSRGPLDDLAPRELQVLRLVAEGRTSKEIAVLLGLGIQTVRTYRKNLMKKIGVTNIAELTQMAVNAGLMAWKSPSKSDSKPQ